MGIDQVAVFRSLMLNREEAEPLVHLERLIPGGRAEQLARPFLSPALSRRIPGFPGGHL